MQEEPKTNEEEKVEPVIEEVDFTKPDFTFIPKGNHLWHQEGYYLICSSCDLVHSSFIGKNKILVGLKDGEAIVKTRKELGLA